MFHKNLSINYDNQFIKYVEKNMSIFYMLAYYLVVYETVTMHINFTYVYITYLYYLSKLFTCYTFT